MKRAWSLSLIVAAFVAFSAYAQSDIMEEDTLEGPAPATGTSGETGTESGPGVQVTNGNSSGATQAVTWTDTNGINFANSKVRFVLEAKDAISEVDFIEYKVNEGPFGRYTGPFSLNQEGPHTIVYRSVDKAGNREADQVYNVTIDNKAPVITLLPARAFTLRNGRHYSSAGNTISFRVSDEGSGVKVVSYGVNSDQLQNYSNELISLSNESSAQLIRFYAEDNLGNKTTDGNFVVNVDADKPSVRIVPSNNLVEAGGRKYARKNTAFVIEAEDKGSGIEQIQVKIDNSQEWQVYSEPLYFSKEEEHTIVVRAVDAVGNESAEVNLTFTTDDYPPRTELKAEITE